MLAALLLTAACGAADDAPVAGVTADEAAQLNAAADMLGPDNGTAQRR